METIAYRLYRKIEYYKRRKQLDKVVLQEPFSKENRNMKITVSLTTYPARFKTLHIAIKSVLDQTVKPDRLIVWLDENVSRDSFTKEMLTLEKLGIQFVNAPWNLKPHKKYIHAMMAYPEDMVITVDDDVIYARDMIETLVKTHEKYPTAVCARRVHRMLLGEDGKILPYNHWIGEQRIEGEPTHELLATGVGGVLYPPHCLYKDSFEVPLIEKLSLNADDIWLKVMEYLNGTKVVWAPCKIPQPQTTEVEANSNLRSDNVVNNRNDEYLNNLMEHYGLKDNCFFK